MTYDVRELVHRYFDAFSRKDIDSLSMMFAGDIELRDWEVEAVGKHAVLNANRKIFNDLASIRVSPIRLIVEENAVAVELLIEINDCEQIRVVDLILFNSDGRISMISAFKR